MFEGINKDYIGNMYFRNRAIKKSKNEDFYYKFKIAQDKLNKLL
jgi:hypothetical protein